MTATVSASESASSWSWVTSSAVAPAARRASRTSARTCARRPASSASKGSSSRTRPGSGASARASATRCCWPPESWWGRRFAEAAEADQLQQLLDPAAAALGARQAEADVGGDVEVGEERPLLGDEADRPPLGGEVGARVAEHPLAEADRAAVGVLEAAEQPQQRRLAAAGGAEDRGQAAGRHLEVEARRAPASRRRPCSGRRPRAMWPGSSSLRRARRRRRGGGSAGRWAGRRSRPSVQRRARPLRRRGVEAFAQNCVASVCVPIGASSSVAVSSVTVARKTSAAAAPRPGSDPRQGDPQHRLGSAGSRASGRPPRGRAAPAPAPPWRRPRASGRERIA